MDGWMGARGNVNKTDVSAKPHFAEKNAIKDIGRAKTVLFTSKSKENADFLRRFSRPKRKL